MKSRLAILLPIVVLVIGLTALIASAGASTQAFTGSLSYQNPNSSLANVVVSFYAQSSGTVVASVPITVPAHGSGTLSFGGVSGLGTSFAGSAVLSADQYMSTDVIEVATTTGYDRAIYAGASSDDAGTILYMPLISQNAFAQLTTFSVQNADSAPVNVRVQYINRDTGQVSKTVNIAALPVGSSKYLKSDAAPASLPAGFTGSAVVTATGKIVASANNAFIVLNKIAAYEGFNAGASKVFLPSAQCNYAAGLQTTFFAIQNTSLAATTNVTVTYYNTAGAQMVTQTVNIPITGGKKYNTNPCLGGMPNGFLGSAVVQATGPAVVALVNTSTSAPSAALYNTIYDGIGTGWNKGAFAYIRWSGTATANDWKTFIACQNVGTSALTGTVKYYNTAGVQQGSNQTFANIGPNIKFNTNPNTAGALTSGAFTGAVEISANGSNLLGCVIQATANTGGAAAAYNAVAVP